MKLQKQFLGWHISDVSQKVLTIFCKHACKESNTFRGHEEEVIELHLWEAILNIKFVQDGGGFTMKLIKLKLQGLPFHGLLSKSCKRGPSNFEFIIFYAFSYRALPQVV